MAGAAWVPLRAGRSIDVRALPRRGPAQGPEPVGLTRKTGLVIGVGLVLLLGVVELLSVTLVMGGFRALESDLAAKDAERLLEAVAEAHAQLDRKASDWAGWDDTYEFMVSRSPAYIESNLNSESLEMLGLCGAAYLDLDGRVVLARGFGGPGEPMVDPCPEMIALVEREPSLRTAPEGAESRHGVVVSPSGEPLLVAVRPILTSQQTGPSRGVLVFAQRLDEMMVSRFERLLRQGVTIRPRRSGGIVWAPARSSGWRPSVMWCTRTCRSTICRGGRCWWVG